MYHGKSIICCNFDIGEPWDIEKILQANKNCSIEDWSERWSFHEPQGYGCPSPLPSFSSLVQEYDYSYDAEQEAPSNSDDHYD